ncbi:Hypothetical protein ERGA_CDS_09190 [Ehrlichia ruminantium str. Gardel]|uniref:hypothetical protein n=1 Tax=Ehrlichia ruminantium TaxID=779 RepID=UPI00004C7982|nr:hypothetical protein [Ehrlichia ruminantium]CAI28371.1 Hypothetical protein ERGA_CDS_09190 [Ehrlichia ruminantium str. Gardel]
MTIFGEFDVNITINGNPMHYVGKITVDSDGNFNTDLHLDHGVGTLGHFTGHLDFSEEDDETPILCYEFTQHALSPGLPEVGEHSGYVESVNKEGDLVFNGHDITISFHKSEEQNVQKVQEEEQEAAEIQPQEAQEVQPQEAQEVQPQEAQEVQPQEVQEVQPQEVQHAE